MPETSSTSLGEGEIKKRGFALLGHLVRASPSRRVKERRSLSYITKSPSLHKGGIKGVG
jgi:hypothetical protein